MAQSRNNQDMKCFKEIIDNTSDLVQYVDSAGHFIHVNKSWKETLGYTDQDLKTLTLWDLVHRQSKEHFQSSFQQAVTSKSTVSIETVLVAKNKCTVPLEGSIKCHADDQGNVVGLWGIFQTIADKPDYETFIKQAELLQNINDNMFDLVSMANPEGIFTYVSKSHRILGFNPESLIGKNVMELVHPDDLSAVAHTLQESISNLVNDVKIEFRYRCADSQYIWLEVLGRIITDNNDNIQELFFSSRDITERKLVEQSLREEQAFRQLLLELATNFINIPLEQYAKAINDMLARIGDYLKTDRIFVFKHDYIQQVTSEAYEWCAEGIGSDKENSQDTSFDYFADILEDMQKGNIIQIPDTAQMPKNHPLKPFFKKQDIRSLLAIPLFHEETNIGFVGFSSINRIRSYTEKETSILQVLAAVISNTLARQQSEKQLVDQKERLTNILQGTNVGTWEWNVQTGETVFNERWAEIIGYTLEELTPVSIDTWSRFTHPEDLTASNEILDHHFKGELDYYDCECRMKHKNGQWIWVQNRGRVITRTADGKPLLMFGTHTDITKQKQAETALRESEKRYRSLVNDVPIGIYRNTPEPDGQFLMANPAFLKIFGFSSEKELVKLKVANLYQDPTERQAISDQMVEKGFISSIELNLKRYDNGEPVWCAVTASAVRDNNGEVKYIDGAIEDITERKQAEEALRQSREQLRQIIDLVPHFIFAKDVSGRFILVNQAVAEAYGTTVEELTGMTDSDFARSDQEVQHFRKYDLQVIESGKPELIPEEQITDSQGSVRFLTTTKIPFTFSGDKSPAVLGVSVDITDRKQAEAALIESEKKYRQILETIEEGYYEVDLQGNLFFFNDSLCRISGYNREELIQINYKKLSWDPLTIFKTFNRVYRTGEPEKAAGWTIITKDKRKIFIELSISLRRDHRGKPIGFQGVIRDITERKQAEEALAEKNKILSILNMYSIQQAEARTYDQLLDLIADQLGNYLDMIAFTYSEYNIAEKTITLKRIKTDQRLIDLAVRMGVKSILDTKIPLSDEQYSEIISSIIVVKSSLAEALLHAIPEKITHAIQKISGTKYLVGLGHIIEGHLYGISMIGLNNELNTATIDFLKSYAHISAISLRRMKAEEEIRYISLHDSLTDLYNRYFLEEEMARLDTARQLPLSVIMADLNGLKMINDTYGHSHGDEMLKTVATIIKSCCRQEDIIARWGGDEFVILLPRTKSIKAETICKRIIARCRECHVEDIPVSIALGFASKTSREEDLVKTLHEAENEMYKQKLAESRSTRSAVLNALLKTLEEKSFETELHTQRMKEIARLIGLKLNLPDAELNRLDLLITLHDIGKINISEEILTKQDQLTEEEWETIKKHPEIGFRITRATEEFSHVAEDILSHHEQWDGSGYPRGLKGKDITLLARITALADAYEVMSNGRPYKKALSHQEIIDEFISCSGKHFDPELVVLLTKDILNKIVLP